VQLGVEQKVVVKTCVGAKGNVTSVNVLRGLGPLADASVKRSTAVPSGVVPNGSRIMPAGSAEDERVDM